MTANAPAQSSRPEIARTETQAVALQPLHFKLSNPTAGGIDWVVGATFW